MCVCSLACAYVTFSILPLCVSVCSCVSVTTFLVRVLISDSMCVCVCVHVFFSVQGFVCVQGSVECVLKTKR